jgi:hypothetical protein
MLSKQVLRWETKYRLAKQVLRCKTFEEMAICAFLALIPVMRSLDLDL